MMTSQPTEPYINLDAANHWCNELTQYIFEAERSLSDYIAGMNPAPARVELMEKNIARLKKIRDHFSLTILELRQCQTGETV